MLDIRVPQIVKSDPFAPGALQNDLEPFPHIARIDGLLRLDPGWEHQVGEDPFPVRQQEFHHGGRQDDGPEGSLGLWLADDQLSAHRVDLLVDLQFPRLFIQVLPSEGQDLTRAQAGGQLQQEQFIHSLLLGLKKEPLDLLPGENLHLLLPRRRQLAAQDGVLFDEAVLDGSFQGHPYHMVAAAHRPLRHSRPLGVPMDLPAIGFHLVQELLTVGLSQLVQRDLPQRQDSVDIDPLLVSFLCGGPDRWLAVVLIPVDDPVPEAHIRLDLEGLRRAAAILKLLQLFQALRLCLGQHTFGFCLSIFIVAYDVLPLPAAVLPQSDSALTIFPFPSHVSASYTMNSSMKPPTISDALRCISPVTWV